ncbi:MAG: hypothetical protein NTW21_33110 [Verrucomicrobia bacterium]|nr:hypothetical protein [Verrucomicrobiota bacterium]
MKIHPVLFALLVLCALAGAFALGRLGQPAPASTPPAPAAVTAIPSQMVPLVPLQSAVIKTDKETLRVEGSASILPAR